MRVQRPSERCRDTIVGIVLYHRNPDPDQSRVLSMIFLGKLWHATPVAIDNSTDFRVKIMTHSLGRGTLCRHDRHLCE